MKPVITDITAEKTPVSLIPLHTYLSRYVEAAEDQANNFMKSKVKKDLGGLGQPPPSIR